MFEVENFDLKHCFLCKVLDILKKRIVIDLEKFCKCHQFRDSDIISVNVNIKMFKKWKIKMYSFPTFIPQLVPLYRLAFL